MLDEQGLIRDGYSLKTIAQELREYCQDFEIKRHTAKCPDKAKKYLECGFPVILRVRNNSLDHAILAIGTEWEGDEDDEKLIKLFCLDPGYAKSATAYWNCIIDLSKQNAGDFPYWYITDEVPTKVEIVELVAITEY